LLAVAGQAAVGDLDDQQDIFCLWVLAGVEIVPRPEHGDVRLWGAQVAEQDRS
jgi:hypothetical protein